VNAQGVVTNGTTPIVILGNTATGTFNKNNATLSESGADAATGTYWGRWTGGYTLSGGGYTAKANGPNHVVYSTHVTSAAELSALQAVASGANSNPQVVNATYNYVGGTSPTRSDGAVGQVNSLSVKANFSSQMITAYDLNLQFGTGGTAQVWDAQLDPAKASAATFANFTGTGPSALGGTPGIDLKGNCTNCSGGTNLSGSAKGLFTGNDARGLMTSFQLQNGTTGSVVNGVGVLERK
jgi:hypothetical protein